MMGAAGREYNTVETGEHVQCGSHAGTIVHHAPFTDAGMVCFRSRRGPVGKEIHTDEMTRMMSFSTRKWRVDNVINARAVIGCTFITLVLLGGFSDYRSGIS